MKPKVAVIGLGGMGAAVSYALSKRGVKVLGFDRFSPPHFRGSSHGDTRIIRQAYFEDPRYIPLLRRVYSLWEEIQSLGFKDLFHRVGLLVLSEDAEGIGKTILKNATEYDVKVELLSHKQVSQTFTSFKLNPSFYGVWEPDAGYLEVERAVQALLSLAEKEGAQIHREEEVLEWGEGQVKTQKENYSVDWVCVCAGAWSQRLLGDVGMPLTVRRAPQFFFDGPEDYKSLPCFAFASAKEFIYGFPKREMGIKIARYAPSKIVTDPLFLDPQYSLEEILPIQKVIEQHLPGLKPEPLSCKMCMYTLTPDENFLIDIHPHLKKVMIATGGSGHAFKFVPLIGELVVQRILEEKSSLDISFLKFRKFTAGRV